MVQGKKITPVEKQKILRELSDGWSMADVARRTGLNYSTVRGVAQGLKNSSGKSWREQRVESSLPEPRARGELGGDALAALDDIVLFARRFFGIVLMPWQVESAEAMVDLLESDDEEWLVINAPPGSGKSTFFTKVVPAWLTCRDRSIRGMIGSAAETPAKWYTRQLRREFERVSPVKADPRELAQGTAVDAVATMAGDYGLFKPVQQDLWTAQSFVVAQVGDTAPTDKEPTWSAFGLDSTYLGGRFPFVIWDDLYDPKKNRTVESREQLKKDYTEVAEARLEPGGLFCLQGQRFSSDDIYRFALDLKAGDTEDDEGNPDGAPKYHHLKFRAHYDDRCEGDHGRNARPYPDGCLLYPRRLSWRRLSTIKKNRSEQFEVVYQQEDVDPAGVLVPALWVAGGTDANGYEYPGCWDGNRDLCELPHGLAGDLVSVACADPSVKNYWAVQWWVVHPETDQWFLMDTLKQSMDAPDFLDWNYNSRAFTGILEEWQARSVDLGIPITHWIVEAVAAQRWLLQYDHTRRWQRRWAVEIIGHQTNRNKSDPELGVETIASYWKFGKIRLPGKQFTAGNTRSSARFVSMRLVDEVTKYPDGAHDDQVMCEWFAHWNFPNIYRPHREPTLQWRPNWLRRRAS